MAMIQHPLLGQVNYELLEVSDDPDTQVSQVISLMTGYVRADARTPEIERDAAEAVWQVAGQGQRAEAEAIFQYVKGRLSFMKDEHTAAPFAGWLQAPVVEALIRPVDMSVLCSDGGCRRIGDCDDFAMYTAALLRARGIRAAFVTVAADQRYPGRFSHVYVAAYPDGHRLALDTSHGSFAGWEVADVTRREEWPIDSTAALLALAGAGLLASLF